MTINKYEYEKFESSHSVYRIDSTKLERLSGQSVSQILNTVPGVHVLQANGSTGSVQDYTLRGGRAKDVLILINGMPINDASQISNFQDLNLITSEDIAQIDVVTGGASTLYGSNAAAGIINIQLKAPSARSNAQAALDYGSYNSFKTTLSGSLPINNKGLSLRLSGNYERTIGFSSAIDTTGNANFDQDGGRQNGVNLGLNYEPDDDIKLQLLSKWQQNEFDFDQGAFTDGLNRQKGNEWVNQLMGKFDSHLGRTTLALTYVKNERDQYMPLIGPDVQKSSSFESDDTQLELSHQSSPSTAIDALEILGGLYYDYSSSNQANFDYLSSAYESTLSSDTSRQHRTEPYLTIMAKQDFMQVDAGLRYSYHNQYGGEFVYHLRPTIVIADNTDHNVSITGAYYTSYNAPSLYQLYSIYGNSNLTPEFSKTLESSLVYGHKGNFSGEITYFKRQEKDVIDFLVTSFGYDNIQGKNTISGWEAKMQYDVSDLISIELNYSDNRFSNEEIAYKLPKKKLGVLSTLDVISNFSNTISYAYVGRRNLPYFNIMTYETETISEKPYHLLNWHSAYQLTPNISLTGTLNNILNQDYIENYGYNTMSINGSIGAKLRVN